MFTKFDIRDGKVLYQKKFLQSEAYRKAIAAKKPVFAEFATPSHISKGFFSQVVNAFSSKGITDNDSLNLFSVEGELFAASESCHIHNFKKNNLETGDRFDFYKLFGVHMACSHPQRDAIGDLYNIATSFTTGCKYQIIKVPNVGTGNAKDALKKTTNFATIYPSWNTCFSYYHSFAMTENYIVMIEQPLLINFVKLADVKLKAKAIVDILEWSPSEKNRFHIVDKRTGEVFKTKIYSAIPFFFFHLANSYEDDGHIVIDVDAYPDSSIFDTMMMGRLRKRELDGADVCRLTRFVIPIIKNVKDVDKGEYLSTLTYTSANAIREGDHIVLSREEIGAPGFEGPNVSPIKHFKKHRYVYGSGTCCNGFYANALCRVDTETKETILWREEPYFFLGEPEFLPSPNATEDDEGIILSAVSDGRDNGKDFLLFIDAKTMTEVSRAVFDNQIPQCVHGQFLPDKKMRNCFPSHYVTF
ncbi:beta,beta-carotene 15,15'-dioxygenase isoform X2 [Folsomia candida]|nr:beta,beta-carotene 15,15'-dioxygenase isoform X2 [Folsomia candida]